MIKVDIYIDGSCSGNPGPGGWAAVCEINERKYAVSGSEKAATNNKMELMAAVGGLRALKKPCEVIFHTDSQYIMTCIGHNDKWLTQSDRKNSDLWFQLIAATKEGGHKVKFMKVKGHAGNTMNELADKLAKAACKKARHELYESR